MLEAYLCQVFTNQSSAASEVKNSQITDILTLCQFLEHHSYFLGVGPASSVVEAFIVLGDVVVVPLGICSLIFVASFHKFDVFRCKSFDCPIHRF